MSLLLQSLDLLLLNRIGMKLHMQTKESPNTTYSVWLGQVCLKHLKILCPQNFHTYKMEMQIKKSLPIIVTVSDPSLAVIKLDGGSELTVAVQE